VSAKTYPHAGEAEKWTVGAAMISQDAAEEIASCPEGFFWDAQISAIGRAISSVYRSGGTVDHVSIVEALKGLKTAQAVAAIPLVLEIGVEVGTDASFQTHFGICRSMYRRRLALKGLAMAAEIIRDETKPIDEAADQAEAAVFAAMDTGATPEREIVLMPQDYVRLAMADFAEAAKGNPYGITSGVPPWDELLGSLKPGAIHILGARPGVGKSMLALQAAKGCGKWALFFSMEMLAIEQVERMIASRMEGVSQEALRSPNFWKAHGDHVAKIMHELRETKIMISDNSSHTIQSIGKSCRRKKKDGQLDLVIMDYLQLVKYEMQKGSREDQAISRVSKGLKQLANELKIPFLCIASLSRENERRDDKRHILSDLKGSGEIESDAHSVTFLYKHSEYDRKMPDEFKNIIELCVKKNRGGQKGTRLLHFDGPRSTFTALSDQDRRNYYDYVNGNKTPQNQAKGFLDD